MSDFCSSFVDEMVEEARGLRIDDETDVDMSEANISYPDLGIMDELNDSIPLAKRRLERRDISSHEDEMEVGSDFSDCEGIELPRRSSEVELASGNENYHPSMLLTLQNDSKISSESTHSSGVSDEERRTQNFLVSAKDGSWVRQVEKVKIVTARNRFITKDLLLEYVNFFTINVNNRPKVLTFATQLVTDQEIFLILMKMFDPSLENVTAYNHSMMRVYCKNAVQKLKLLGKCLFGLTKAAPDLEIEYGDVIGELRQNRSSHRFRTSDMKAFFTVEDQAKTIGMRILSSFHLRMKNNSTRDVSVRWYDEPKSGGQRDTYIMLDHFAYPVSRLSFNPTRQESEFEVESAEEMVPTSNAFPPVHDLIGYLQSIAVGESSL